MKAVSIEHSKAVYFADFAFYLVAIVLLLGVLVGFAPRHALVGVALAVIAGAVCWSLIEYLMHRVIFHGIEPFQRMHGEHHRRPQALIATPTALSAAFIMLLVWLPATLLSGAWLGLGATLGMTADYFAYGLIHHAMHHWRPRGAWMRQRKRLHALHHRAPQQNYGVTTSLWDHVFRSFRQSQVKGMSSLSSHAGPPFQSRNRLIVRRADLPDARMAACALAVLLSLGLATPAKRSP